MTQYTRGLGTPQPAKGEVPEHPHFGLGGLGAVALLTGLIGIALAIAALVVTAGKETVDPSVLEELANRDAAPAAAVQSEAPDVVAASESAEPGGQGVTVVEGDVIEIVGTEFKFDPSQLELAPGTYTIRFTNEGSILHDITFSELVDGGHGNDALVYRDGEEVAGNKIEAEPGEIVEFEIVVPESDGLLFICSIPGHREAGMEGTIVTAGSAPVAGTTVAASTEGTWARQPAEPVTIDEISRHPSELPPSADYTLYDDGEYQNFVDRTGPITQEVHFYLEEGVAEVLPGTTMDYWTFDGAVPGPMIRTRVGDSVHFFLHNPEDSAIPHNVDFHAVTGPGGGAVVLDTAPGAVSDLTIKTLAPGIYIYHCAFPDIPTHLAHGMYGLIVVEPEEGLPPVDQEYYLLQSDWYTVAGGSLSTSQLEGVGHLAFDGRFGNLEEPTFVTFNGRPNAVLGDRAIGTLGDPIQTGDTVRLFVGNAGPNLVSSFHAIGEIFDTVYVEGSFSLVNRNVQSTLIPAGGAVGVEFRVEVPGSYVLVDHSIFRIHKGALAILTAEGEPVDPTIFQPGTFSEVRG